MHAVRYGALMSSVFVAIVLASYRVDKTIWLRDVSEGRLAGNEAGGFVMGLAVFATAAGFMLVACLTWAMGQPYTYGEFVVIGFVAFQVLNLVDLLLVDGLLYHFAHPSFMRFEGVPKVSFKRHVRDALVGIAVGAVLSALVAGIAAVLVTTAIVQGAPGRTG
jgi:hypothetical protein